MLYVAGFGPFIGNKCEVGVYVNGSLQRRKSDITF